MGNNTRTYRAAVRVAQLAGRSPAACVAIAAALHITHTALGIGAEGIEQPFLVVAGMHAQPRP